MLLFHSPSQSACGCFPILSKIPAFSGSLARILLARSIAFEFGSTQSFTPWSGLPLALGGCVAGVIGPSSPGSPPACLALAFELDPDGLFASGVPPSEGEQAPRSEAATIKHDAASPQRFSDAPGTDNRWGRIFIGRLSTDCGEEGKCWHSSAQSMRDGNAAAEPGQPRPKPGTGSTWPATHQLRLRARNPRIRSARRWPRDPPPNSAPSRHRYTRRRSHAPHARHAAYLRSRPRDSSPSAPRAAALRAARPSESAPAALRHHSQSRPSENDDARPLARA